MDDVVSLIIGLVVLAVLVALLVLPIIALVISIRTRAKLKQAILRPDSTQSNTPSLAALTGVVQQLTLRVARLEATLGRKAPADSEPQKEPAQLAIQTHTEPETPPGSAMPPMPGPPAPSLAPTQPSVSPAKPMRTIQAQRLDSIIGGRWLGWVSVLLILFATAFFLKYAFDNRWIGELGRVAIGVAAGITLTTFGFNYYRKNWRIFSQILTGGGVILLYLSAYASFGYYHLAAQKAAFIYLAILIAETTVLALLYDAPAIAVMALIGGFLAPVLLRSDRDQYRSLFTYLAGLDIGALALLKQWCGLSSIAFIGTHSLFWLWYVDNYHPRKLGAVMIFQSVVFLLFLLAQLGRRLFSPNKVKFEDLDWMRRPSTFFVAFEDFSLLLINPFTFFTTSYSLLNPNHHDWMGVFAIGTALVYAGGAKLLLDRSATTRTELLLMIGVALTFVTLAIPIQLRANWITMAWAVEGLVVLWAALKMSSQRLAVVGHTLLLLALGKLVLWDTPFDYRPMFTPVLNKYFLSSLFVTFCLFAAAYIHEKYRPEQWGRAHVVKLVLVIIAVIVLWFLMTVETHTFFAARAATQKVAEDVRHQRWLGQMALSVLWSIYAAVLMAVGFVRRAAAIRWAALSLFALTVIKVMIVDIAVLRQLYRIIAFLVLGLLLLVVAWGYHKVFHSGESE